MINSQKILKDMIDGHKTNPNLNKIIDELIIQFIKSTYPTDDLLIDFLINKYCNKRKINIDNNFNNIYLQIVKKMVQL